MSFDLSINDLFKFGVHYGHLSRFKNPKMMPYIFGSNNKISLINLDKTIYFIKKSMQFVKKISSSKGTLLFVGTKKVATKIIEESAKKCNMPYINHRWLGGTLTNYKTIKQSINKLKILEIRKKDKKFDILPKKERLNLTKQLDRLNLNLGGIKDMENLPDAIFVVDVGYEKIAVQEANKLKIPVIGIVDTNNSPTGIDFLIPGNDDSIKSISLYLQVISDCILNNNK